MFEYHLQSAQLIGHLQCFQIANSPAAGSTSSSSSVSTSVSTASALVPSTLMPDTSVPPMPTSQPIPHHQEQQQQQQLVFKTPQEAAEETQQIPSSSQVHVTSPLSHSSVSTTASASGDDSDVPYIHGADENLYVCVEQKKAAPKKLQFDEPEPEHMPQPQPQQDSSEVAPTPTTSASALDFLRYVIRCKTKRKTFANLALEQVHKK